MTIQKAHFNTDGDNLRLSMPFSKVDQERRIVSGFATLDNVDRQMDVVPAEASIKAFSKFRGNIREMHKDIAVGKMLSFREEKYFDPESKKFYSGVYVSAYVSKGAQDCWEKVLDGTYTGFSIGGRMKDYETAYDEKMDSTIRIIKEYDLVELSLVDSPANQFASIISIEKADTVINNETIIENVFWDKESGIVILSEQSSVESPVNGAKMQNIGFVEKSDDEKVNMIKFLVDSAKGINTSKMNKEDNMTDITNEVPVVEEQNVEIAPEADAVVEEAPVAEVTEEVTEKADEILPSKPEDEDAEDAVESEAEDDMKPVSKADTDVSDLKDAVTSAFSELTSVIKSLSDEVAELKKSVNLANEKISDAESDFNNLGKRIDAVEADTAFRKSGDLGEIVQEPAMVEKSVWGGRFLNSADLLK